MSTPQLPTAGPVNGHARQSDEPNSFNDPEYFDGIPLKRVVAYIVDVFVISIFAAAVAVIAFVPVVLTLGMLKPFILGVIAVIPLSYHTLLIGSDRPATVGMRLLGIEVRTINGDKPGYVVAELLSKVGDGGFQAARSISFSPSLNLTPSTISARR